ncbi:ATP-binding cassette domain-containing protein [Streptomyces albidoflavus]|uniref:ATP-binding cassette domain-containing protein n=1 Tax=Streptomyces albidoflavus TaxID=1886 RepID=UPI0039833E77
MRWEEVGKRYGMRGGWVLRDVDAECRAGEVVAVVGRNGSGKSTLLRLAAGLTRPSRGTVTGRPRVVGYVRHGAQTDSEAVRATRERLRALRRVHGDRVTVFSAHAPWEWARLTTPTPLPAPAHPGD